MSQWKPYFCLDFDAVLHDYSSGWLGAAVIPDPPVPGAVEACREYVGHFRVVIHSSRCSEPEGVEAIREWLRLHKFPEEIEVVTQKPPALLTLDDRALTFTGVFPSAESIKAFQPWNKRVKRTIEDWEGLEDETISRLWRYTDKVRRVNENEEGQWLELIAADWGIPLAVVERAVARATADEEFVVHEAIEYLYGYHDALNPDNLAPVWSPVFCRCVVCGEVIRADIEECTAGKVHPECYDSDAARP